MAGDLDIIAALLRQMVNYHDSWIHRLPSEMLVAAASHLKDNASLVAATHVCHLWRIALLSSPRLWSHLDFANEERALVFLERSKSAPLSVDLTGVDVHSEIARESLKDVTTRVTMLRGAHNNFLDRLLTQPLTTLETLEISDCNMLPPKEPTLLPSLTSLVISGFDPRRFHAPLLTSFHLTHDSASGSLERKQTTASLLDFFRNCPLLEVVFISCDILDIHTGSGEVVSLPFLSSFTHESPRDRYQPSLFNRLSIPSTCRVVLVIDVTDHRSNPWIPGLPTPRDPSFLSDIRTVKIAAHSRSLDAFKDYIMFKVELTSSTHRTTSFNRISRYSQRLPIFSYIGFLDILGTIELDSVETLCFDRCPVPRAVAGPITQALGKFRNLETLILIGPDLTLSLDSIDLSSYPAIDTLVFSSNHDIGSPYYDVLYRLQGFAILRKRAGSPLKTLTIVYPFAEPRPVELERLKRCVGRVEVVSDRQALNWDVNEYLLAVATHKDNVGGL